MRLLLEEGADVNARNCLGCVPLMYAAGSGQLEVVRLLLHLSSPPPPPPPQVVRLLLGQPNTCLNIRGNDRLTTFMLAMQAGREVGARSGQEQLKRMMDVPATSEGDWVRNDKWTVLMEAASFGQAAVVAALLERPGLDLEGVNVRGQTAVEVAVARGHLQVAHLIRAALESREKPAEVARILLLPPPPPPHSSSSPILLIPPPPPPPPPSSSSSPRSRELRRNFAGIFAKANGT